MLTLWRANLLGSSSKGHEYFLRHLLGVDGRRGAADGVAAGGAAAARSSGATTPRRASSTCFTTIDFRMNGSALFSDVVLPAATWYEKDDLSSTDLHPFVHSFNPAIPPPWEARTDWDTFERSPSVSRSSRRSTSAPARDLVAAPLLHDTPDELAQPFGEVRDWQRGECEPVPGKTMPKLVAVERDYTAVAASGARSGRSSRSSGSRPRASR